MYIDHDVRNREDADASLSIDEKNEASAFIVTYHQSDLF